MQLTLVFFGMTATGKSYLARAWAEKWQCPYFNSDSVRKELAGRVPESRVKSALNDGIYSPVFTRRTYDELMRRAELEILEKGVRCIVLDASYQSRKERDLVRYRLGGLCRVIFVHCICSEPVIRERLIQRANDPHAVSEGHWQIYLEQKKNFDIPKELGAGSLITLETEKTLPELLQILEENICVLGENLSFTTPVEKRKL